MIERRTIQWVSLALMIVAVACSGAEDESSSSAASASASSGSAASASSGTGGAGIGGSHAAAVAFTSLQCDGGAGPGGDLTDLHLIIDQDPFVCDSPCETVFYGDLNIDCEGDWRLHVRVPAAPGVYAADTDDVNLWLVSGKDPQNPAACASHSDATGTVEITSVSDVEVVGVLSNVSIEGVPGVNPNGPFTAPRCD